MKLKLVLANGEGFPTAWEWWCPKCGEHNTCFYDPIGVSHEGNVCGGIIVKTKPIYG